MLLFLVLACTGADDAPATSSATETQSETDLTESEETARYTSLTVAVTLDGAPAPDVWLQQGGVDAHWLTGDDGTAVVRIDHDPLLGEVALHASHPDARIQAGFPDIDDTTLTIELESFSTSDNPDYVFQHPGSPSENSTTNYCAHCHYNIVDDFDESVHKTAASNPVVHDVYAGAAAFFDSEDACEAVGGQWWTGLVPGTGEAGERCYVGAGVLPDLNDCGDTEACDGKAEQTGQCADCHAPAIDGELGGRDLLEATDIAYDYGVHCDLCHKVESVDLESDDPGVAGKLRVVRPSEDSPSMALGDYWPLTFGPYPDVSNVRMGSVQRDHFASGELCGGCHEHHQEGLAGTVDTERWSDGRLPIHTTFSEWQDSAFGDTVPCLACHMPPNPEAGNASAIEVISPEPENQGSAAGWFREPGAVRHHSWYGPRHPDERMVDLAAAIDLDTSVADGTLTVQATVTNVGPAHAIPTGEPLRSLLLLVEASCEGEALTPSGGDVVPDYGGALEVRTAEEDWTSWPDAEVGQVLRVVSLGEAVDYDGWGPFGDGTFSADDKGVPEEHWVGEVTIEALADGVPTLSGELPEGDVVYRVTTGALPEDGDDAGTWAGHPGFGFARVLADADGNRMVPHHRAVDVVSDLRLWPQQAWTSEHTFAADCEAPTVHAQLLHRAYPLDLAEERGWTLTETVMAEATR